MKHKAIALIQPFAMIALALCLSLPEACAEAKVFTAGGDGSTWADDDNWSPAGTPGSEDDVLIDRAGSDVATDRTFSAKTIVVGGNVGGALTVPMFVSGEVSPATTTEDAVVNSAGGAMTLQGSAGTVALKGTYRFSKTAPAVETCAMFWIK